MRKSTPDHYGTVAISVHWLTVILVLVLLFSGFQAEEAGNDAGKVAFLRMHIPLGIAVLLLTVFRVVWWWRFDPRPNPVAGSPRWQERMARGVHAALYVIVLGMVASGIAMVALTGAGSVIFGGDPSLLPDFSKVAPRAPHGAGASLLIALLVVHSGAALYHQFVRRDAVLRRMWYGI